MIQERSQAVPYNHGTCRHCYIIWSNRTWQREPWNSSLLKQQLVAHRRNQVKSEPQTLPKSFFTLRRARQPFITMSQWLTVNHLPRIETPQVKGEWPFEIKQLAVKTTFAVSRCTKRKESEPRERCTALPCTAATYTSSWHLQLPNLKYELPDRLGGISIGNKDQLQRHNY
jgi:hypothetical protein